MEDIIDPGIDHFASLHELGWITVFRSVKIGTVTAVSAIRCVGNNVKRRIAGTESGPLPRVFTTISVESIATLNVEATKVYS